LLYNGIFPKVFLLFEHFWGLGVMFSLSIEKHITSTPPEFGSYMVAHKVYVR